MIIWTSVPDKLAEGHVFRRDVTEVSQLHTLLFTDLFNFVRKFPSNTVTSVIEDGSGRVIGLAAYGADEIVLKVTSTVAGAVTKADYSKFSSELSSFSQAMLRVIEIDDEIPSRYGD